MPFENFTRLIGGRDKGFDFAPPSEPDGRISRIRLSSQWGRSPTIVRFHACSVTPSFARLELPFRDQWKLFRVSHTLQIQIHVQLGLVEMITMVQFYIE